MGALRYSQGGEWEVRTPPVQWAGVGRGGAAGGCKQLSNQRVLVVRWRPLMSGAGCSSASSISVPWQSRGASPTHTAALGRATVPAHAAVPSSAVQHPPMQPAQTWLVNTLPNPPPSDPSLLKVYKRVDLGNRQEEYRLIGTFPQQPGPGEITECFNNARQR